MSVEDFPANLLEFEHRFSTDEACRSYLLRVRWPEGFCCPRCGNNRAWQTARGLLHCTECDRETSVTAGTLLEDTRKPLHMWFHAMWWMYTQKVSPPAWRGPLFSGITGARVPRRHENGVERVLGRLWRAT